MIDDTFIRWNKCVAKASSDYTGFGMAVGHKYVIANFPETAKEDVRYISEYIFEDSLIVFIYA